jgi:hypothetical protein
MRSGAGRVNLDNDVAEYEAAVKGMIPLVARAFGHTGVLTQQDVDSVRNMFPKVGDNKTLAENKMARIKRQIAQLPGNDMSPVSSHGAPGANTALAELERRRNARK